MRTCCAGLYHSEQDLVGISTIMLVVFYIHLELHMTRHMAIMRKHDVIHKTGST